MNVTFTEEDLARFKKTYGLAKKENKITFNYAGRDYDLGYARYLIEYLDLQVKKK